MRFDLKTREQLRELNAQSWADFKAHWPLHLFQFFINTAVAACIGFAFGLFMGVWVLTLYV